MTRPNSTSRRDFLTLSAGGAAALAIGGSIGASNAVASAWTPAIKINPAIDGKNVVYCQNSPTNKMMPDLNPKAAATFHTQNAALDAALIRSNMDAMALTLTGKATADAAWATIFMRPAEKPWSQVKVFLKTNGTIHTIMAHIPVVSKVCEELMKLGVQGSNIIISDPGRCAAGPTKYTPYIDDKAPYAGGKGLPAGVKVSAEVYPEFAKGTGRTGGKTPNIPIGDGTQKVWCTKDLVVENSNGGLAYVADIIVNLAVNKGHPGKPQIADLTLSMKNHVGTFAVWGGDTSNDCPGDPAFNGGQPGGDFLIALNQSEAIMGSGPGYPVRQQLIIMDSLWASKAGPHVSPDIAPGILAMGTCSGVMDWLMYEKVRKTIMGVTINAAAMKVLTKFVTSFGYQPDNLQWIPAGSPTAIGDKVAKGAGLNTHDVTFLADSNERVNFTIEAGARAGAYINVYAIDGKLLRELGNTSGKSIIRWDGRTQWGSAVPAGKYVVKLHCGNRTYAKAITVMNRVH